MKPFLPLFFLAAAGAVGQAADTYVNYIYQEDLSTGVASNPNPAPVADSGTKESDDVVSESGARFELVTFLATSPFTEYPLDERTVGSYFPLADVTITTEDPYTVIPRTRADRPFTVNVTLTGLLSGASDPAAAKSVNLLHHVQSYGAGGTGVGIDRSLATLLTTESVSTNGNTSTTYSVTSIPSADLTKTRGEERISVYSLEDTQVSGTGTYHVDAAQLASKYVQIWPVAEGSISGISTGQKVLFALPQVTLTYKDLYPSSTTYAQVYQGPAVLGTAGVVVPGSAKTYAETVPQEATLTLTNWDSPFTADGQWTLEVVTVTPFGTERLAYVTFDLDRTIEVNSNITTSD